MHPVFRRSSSTGRLIFSITCLICSSFFPVPNCQGADLEAGFRSPPAEAKCRVYWWWLNSHVTKDSITEDLEEMKKQGIGGALLFDSDNEVHRMNKLIPHGPDFGSPEYRQLFAHALQEADRLGIEISFLIQSGWNLGGPSVSPEEGAKLVTWSETKLIGGQKIDVPLRQPKQVAELYRDIAVVACPIAEPTGDVASTTFEVSASSNEPGRLAPGAFDGDTETYWCTAGHKPGDCPTPARPDWIAVKFNRPIQVSSLLLQGRKNYGPKKCTLEVAEGGSSFRPVVSIEAPAVGSKEVKFEPVTGDTFRLMIHEAYDAGFPDATRHVAIQEITLQGEKETWPPRATIENLAAKIASKEVDGSLTHTSYLMTDVPSEPDDAVANLDQVIDLTSNMSADGRLQWDAPSGEWHVLRFGYTGSGGQVVNGSGGWGGRVLDHLDTGALVSYWDQTIAPFTQDPAITPYVGKSWKYVHSDSWEMGGMNWSKKFREEFRNRRRYDLLKYMPVIAGKIVDSREVSTRFLNDYRRTIAECIAENHYKAFTRIAHKNHLLVHAEAGGPHGAPIDALESLGHSDVPMMEFWAESPTHRVAAIDRFFVKQAASAAHIYGKKIVAAEGETTIGTHWEESFRNNLKPTFDRAICEGLNRLVFHQFTASPKSQGLPGQEYFAGTHFSPRSTWWPLVHGWLGYVNRCQYMMQQGTFVADVCYYNGDNIPNLLMMKDSDPAGALPTYDYDGINQDVLLNRLSVRDNRLVLPSGMSYRVLALPKHGFISLEALRKIADLVIDGAMVVGPKPTALTGLREYPACDQELKQLTDDLWGNCDGKKVTEHAYGMGKVFWMETAKEALAALKILPDLQIHGQGELQIDYIHRSTGDAEIYFLANRTNKPGYVECTFRVKDLAPEFWSPESGEIKPSMLYATTGDGRVVAPLYLEPYGSAMIVFRSKPGRHIVALSKDGERLFPAPEKPGKPIPVQVVAEDKIAFAVHTNVPGKYEITDDAGKVYRATIAEPKVLPIDGTWTVSFTQGWGPTLPVIFDKLTSWTESNDPSIKHFSGMATYASKFDVPAELLEKGRTVELDLGDLQEMGDVTLNGKLLGTFWKPPFQIDVTSLLKAGENTIHVRVANHWRNRLIGDAGLSEPERLTKTNIVKFEKGKHELLPSGLLGPVVIRSFTQQRQLVKK